MRLRKQTVPDSRRLLILEMSSMSDKTLSIKEEARGRQVVYAFLGRLFERELGLGEVLSIGTGEGMQVLLSLSEAGVAWNSANRLIAATGGGDERTVERLSVEYSRLFNAHNRIYSHASCWLGERPRLMGEPWREVLDFYHREGLVPREENIWLADHVGTQLYFASVLSERIAQAESARDARKSLEILVEYLKTHVMTWVPRFLDRVAGDPRADFYADAAIVGLGFVEMDARMLGIDVYSAEYEGQLEEVRR